MEALDNVIGQNAFLVRPVLFEQDELVEASDDVLDLSSLPGFEKQMREVEAAALVVKQK